MIKNYLIIFVMALLLSGCQGRKVVFESNVTFENENWQRFKKEHFVIDINNASSKYDLELEVRHNENLQYPKVEFFYFMQTPSGEERSRSYTANVVDRNYNYIGEKDGETYVVTVPIKTDFEFQEEGKCKIQLESSMQNVDVFGIEGITLRLIRR